MRTVGGAPYGTLHPAHTQENVSLTFVNTVVAAARYTAADLKTDVETSP